LTRRSGPLLLGCKDVALLDRWIRLAASAATSAEVFAA